MTLQDYTLLAVELARVLETVHASASLSRDLWDELDVYLDTYLREKLGSAWYERFRKMWESAAADSIQGRATASDIRKKNVFRLMEGMPSFHTMGLLCVLAETAPQLE